LQQKKYRIANKLFFAEGVKGIQELSSNFVLEHLYTTQHDFEEALSKKTIIQESD
jgi:TrmH family RNA methyltransferase